jgi:hypothetical protein
LVGGFFRNSPTDWRLRRFRLLADEVFAIKAGFIEKGIIERE